MKTYTISVELPPHLVDHLKEGGKVAVKLVQGTETYENRYPTSGHTIKELREQTAPDVLAIIDHWNEHQYIKALEDYRGDEIRNYPVTKKNWDKTVKACVKMLKKLNEKQIMSSMDDYLSACEEGNHVWVSDSGISINHGYKSLSGFLRKLYVRTRDGERAWWDSQQAERPIPDENPDLTESIANAFARKFLSKSKYHLKNPSRDYRNFALAASRVKEVMEASGGTWSYKKFISHLLKCAEESKFNPDDTIYPGNLVSTKLWEIEFPQYLRNMGFKLPRKIRERL